MIDYQREQQQTIPEDQVKIIGIGGAGANILDRVALDGTDAKSMMVLNSDTRTLQTAMAGEKIQMGKKLTMGLGAGGDPDIGLKAAQEVETELRDALRNQKIVFLCVGLGGGTGSGAAPLVTRIAREQGAFVVVFATMPFGFEGTRRLEQAETALNELSVLSNALVTFDNSKMGELVLANQGIHEAFSAADVMISQSVSAVIRLVAKPGIINVGLDDLMSALKATKSRCLFGSGLANGEDRSHKALKNALNSPLLDKGSLLRSATTVLVHICGGKTLSLFEVELLMRELAKHVPKEAHILFGAAVDDAMGDDLSVTVISALPESMLLAKKSTETESSSTQKVAAVASASVAKEVVAEPAPEPEPVPEPEPELEPVIETKSEPEPEIKEEPLVDSTQELPNEVETAAVEETPVETSLNVEEQPKASIFADAKTEDGNIVLETKTKETMPVDKLLEGEKTAEEIDNKPLDSQKVVVGKSEISTSEEKTELPPKREPVQNVTTESKDDKPQAELQLDGGPKGKFSGESPNMVDGEDLDIPPYLRNR